MGMGMTHAVKRPFHQGLFGPDSTDPLLVDRSHFCKNSREPASTTLYLRGEIRRDRLSSPPRVGYRKSDPLLFLKTVADPFFEVIHRGQSGPDWADWKKRSLVKCPHKRVER